MIYEIISCNSINPNDSTVKMVIKDTCGNRYSGILELSSSGTKRSEE